MRARTKIDYGPFATATATATPEVGPVFHNEDDNTIATPAVLAVLGWIILIAIVVAIVVFVFWYRRHQSTKILEL